MSQEYAVDIYHHLRRARQQLDSGKQDGIFYAAFELRCGVESRIQDYLNAHEDISKKKKKGWKVAVAGRQLDKAFKDGLKIVEFTMVLPKSNYVIHFFHTPVGSELRIAIGKLGNLMHAQKEMILGDSPWWSETREFLEITFKMTELLAQGTLLAPVLTSPSGQFTMYSYFHMTNPMSKLFHDRSLLDKGTQLVINVAYHDDMPDYALPYLNDWLPNNQT